MKSMSNAVVGGRVAATVEGVGSRLFIPRQLTERVLRSESSEATELAASDEERFLPLSELYDVPYEMREEAVSVSVERVRTLDLALTSLKYDAASCLLSIGQLCSGWKKSRESREGRTMDVLTPIEGSPPGEGKRGDEPPWLLRLIIYGSSAMVSSATERVGKAGETRLLQVEASLRRGLFARGRRRRRCAGGTGLLHGLR